MVWLYVIGAILTPGLLLVLLALKAKLTYPEKSMFYCFLNTFLLPLRIFKLGPYRHGTVTLEKAMKYAMKKTKLQDFGPTTFTDSYAVIANTETHKSLKLTNVGHIQYRLELNMSMCRRLKFIQYLKDVPAVANVKVPTPVFVMGLPRCGTTFLHRLMSLDPQVRAPLLWELLSPVPGHAAAPEAKNFEEDREKRAKFIRKLIADRQRMGDHAMDHIHEIGADLPEECLMALSDEIPVHLSFLYSVYMNYETFFSKIDPTRVKDAYLYYKKVLQLLSYQLGETNQPRRWTLKCPIHLYYVKELAAAFPDAKLVWTHRHPVSAVPSLCSLVKAVHQVYYEPSCRDDAAAGRSIANMTAKYLKLVPQDIKQSGLDCAHVIYNELISDPVNVVRSIYKQFGWTFTAEYEKIIKDYLAENLRQREELKAKKGGKAEVLHTYTAEEFSLTSQELCEGEFANYVKRYNVPMSTN